MIYIVTHKSTALPALEGFRGIQVGNAAERFPGCLRDDTGDNISRKNASYCELTALYWVWRNAPDARKGLAHYRRYFARRRLGGARDLLDARALDAALKGSDILLAEPAVYHVNARAQLLMDCCDAAALDSLDAVVEAQCPDYAPACRAFFAGNRASQYNMLYCDREVFDAYCAWLFPLLFALEARVDLSGESAYRQRLYGFLGERLLNVWVARNGLRAKYLPVVNTEDTLAERLTYLRRDVTNGLRFRLSGGRGGR